METSEYLDNDIGVFWPTWVLYKVMSGSFCEIESEIRADSNFFQLRVKNGNEAI